MRSAFSKLFSAPEPTLTPEQQLRRVYSDIISCGSADKARQLLAPFTIETQRAVLTSEMILQYFVKSAKKNPEVFAVVLEIFSANPLTPNDSNIIKALKELGIENEAPYFKLLLKALGINASEALKNQKHMLLLSLVKYTCEEVVELILATYSPADKLHALNAPSLSGGQGAFEEDAALLTAATFGSAKMLNIVLDAYKDPKETLTKRNYVVLAIALNCRTEPYEKAKLILKHFPDPIEKANAVLSNNNLSPQIILKDVNLLKLILTSIPKNNQLEILGDGGHRILTNAIENIDNNKPNTINVVKFLIIVYINNGIPANKILNLSFSFNNTNKEIFSKIISDSWNPADRELVEDLPLSQDAYDFLMARGVTDIKAPEKVVSKVEITTDAQTDEADEPDNRYGCTIS